LALRAKKVIAVDNSEKMVAFGAKKRNATLEKLEFRLGDLEKSAHRFSEHRSRDFKPGLHHAADPEGTIASTYRLLRPVPGKFLTY